ncbi:MAG: P-loop NTPase [Nitrososphaerales archaeon]|nr:P-loop NTPase [Nitrososphaerales archaeon]
MVLLGYYLAEGSVVRKKNRGLCAVRFTFGISEREFEFANELTRAASRLGFNPNLYKAQTGWRVEISSTALSRWLEQEFGTGAREKRVPLWIKLLPPEKLDWLFNCYVNGDGHRSKIETAIKTVSLQLAAAIRDIGLKLGYLPSVSVREGNSDFQGRYVHANKIYRVGFTSSRRTRFDNDYVYLRVKNAERIPYQGEVYNLEVAEDNSFCTPYQTLHNCGEKAFIFSTGGGRRMAAGLNVDFLGEIPLDVAIREQSDLGVPVVSAEPDSPQAVAFKELAFRLAGMVSIVAFSRRGK